MLAAMRIIFIGLANLLVIAALLELGGLQQWHAGRGGLFYLRPPPAEVVRVTTPFTGSDYWPVLHPYFGTVYAARGEVAAGQGFYVNNHNFLQEANYVRRHPDCCDFPVTNGDEAIIGIFGGSVATAVAIWAQADDYLATALKDDPRYRNRRVRVLNFASGGYKQPQQLQILAYFLSLGQRFDTVVTIDGLNEVVLGQDTNAAYGVDVTSPVLWPQLAKLLTEQILRRDASAYLSAYHEIAHREWARRAEDCPVAACFLLAHVISAGHRYMVIPTRPARQLDHFALTPARNGDSLTLVADNWEASLRLMHSLLAAKSIPFLAILQPNPWFRPNPYRTQGGAHQFRLVPAGYRALLARLPGLRASGVAVRDETGLFNDRGDEIYADDLGHFVTEGNRRLVDVIVRWLLMAR